MTLNLTSIASNLGYSVQRIGNGLSSRLPLLTARVAAQIKPVKALDHLPPQPDFMAGGKWLVDATLKYGVNERGEKLRITRPFLETLQLIGDFRIAGTYTSGAAQLFKTLSTWQLACALITIGRHDFAWIYPQTGLIPKLVPSQFKPIIGAWELATGLHRKESQSDSKSMTIHQSVLGTGRFAAANNSAAASKERDGTAAANTNVVSFSIDLTIYEERSQYSQKAVDAIRRRSLQSRIPTRPERLIGTPGNGGGIEVEISKADYEFWPHVYCNGCGELSNLSPLGWLLKPDSDEEYFDAAGRPLNWHGKEDDAPYFGCPYCARPITLSERLDAHFRCVRTGVGLMEMLDDLPIGIPSEMLTAGIILSPLLRDSGIDPAADLIYKGLYGADVADWHQQELGLPTKFTASGISVLQLQAAIDLEIPSQPIDFSVWGLDQGTNEHWLCMIDYRRPDNWAELSDIQIYEQSHRNVTRLSAVRSDDLYSCVSHCDGGAIDNEPGREYAAGILTTFENTFAFDQRGGRELGGLVSRPGIVEFGGQKIKVVLCDTHRLQDMILAALTTGVVTINCKFDTGDLSASSPTRHLTTSSRNPETGKWSRPDDHKDDLLKAWMACELWYYLECTGQKVRGTSLVDMD